MNIIFVVNSMGKGGAERVITNLSTYLSKKHNVSIISIYNVQVEYRLDKKVNFYTLDENIYNIYDEQNEKNEQKSTIIKKIKRFFQRIKKINQYKKDLNADIILTFMQKPSFLVLLSNILNKVPTIVSVRNDPKIEFKTKKDKTLMKLLYPKADGYVFQTKDAEEYFNDKIKGKSEIIPNPINPYFIEKSFEGERDKKIVSVGRLEYQKNQEMLIKAFSMLPKKYKDYKLIIYGEGRLRKQLEDLVKKLNIQERVLLPGNIEDVKEKIYRATMFVLSSRYEGMPNALMEAMALGLPVISTDCPCGGPRFLIQNNENGILVENENIKELENAMEKLLENQDFASKLGENANKIADTLNPEKINNLWEKYIKKVYSKSRIKNKVKGDNNHEME